MSGNKITFSRSSGAGNAYNGGYTWGYNNETTYLIEFEDGKDIRLDTDDVIPYNGKVLRLTKTDGKVPDTYNWPYYRNIWELDDNQDASIVKSVSLSMSYRMQHGTSAATWSYLDMGWAEEDIEVSQNENDYQIYAHSKKGNISQYVKFKFTKLGEGKYSDVSSLDVGYDESDSYKVDFTATNIAFNSKSSSIIALWKATHDTGLGISGFTYSDKYDWEEHYYQHPENELLLSVEFK